MNENLLITYILPRQFSSLNIPVPIQSTFMRDYAKKNGFIFQLPIVEICLKNSYYLLLRTLEETNNLKINICLSSILILPIDNMKLMNKILLLNQQSVWHFPLENISLINNEIPAWVDNYNHMKNSSRYTADIARNRVI